MMMEVVVIMQSMHRDMVMKTQNCFQNAEQMHRGMEMKTENCFQNADYADAQPWTLEKQYADAIPPQCPHRLK